MGSGDTATHIFNHCCRYRWSIMFSPLPNGKNPYYLFYKLGWPQGQYRCDSKEILLHCVYDGFCVLWVYVLEVWGAFIPSLKHHLIVTQVCTMLVEHDPTWRQSVHKNCLCVTVSLNISTRHSITYFVFKSQSPIVCRLAKWLATTSHTVYSC
jgi:hypothetical protein